MDEDKKLELKYKYAWNWFQYHAQQRLTSFRYFLLIVGALFVGYQKSFEGGQPAVLRVFISSFGILISVAFYLLEIRNEELVNCGRDSLDTIEKEIGLTIREGDKDRTHLNNSLDCLSNRIGYDKLKDITKHKTWFRVIYLYSGFVFLCSGFVFLCSGIVFLVLFLISLFLRK
jgi:fatty acid desaturase